MQNLCALFLNPKNSLSIYKLDYPFAVIQLCIVKFIRYNKNTRCIQEAG